MRTIVNNPYHLWANEVQSHARNSTGNCSFTDSSAYSYRAEIGRIVRNGKERAFIVSNRSWSVTTSGHQSAMRRAIPGGVPVFHLYSCEPNHKANVTEYLEDIARLGLKVKNARSRKDWAESELAARILELREYVRFFKVKGVKIPDNATVENLAGKLEAFQAKERAAERKREKAKQAELADRITKWVAGENVYLPYGLGEAYLRIRKDDPETVETSQGADVPTDHARKALARVLRIMQAGQTWHTNGETIRVGVYSVVSVNPETAVVGCHRFARAELERFATVLGQAA